MIRSSTSESISYPEYVRGRIAPVRTGQDRWKGSYPQPAFPAKVMSGATRWLEENARKKPFFLQVESFDVHEPFHVPEPYASMYGDGEGSEKFTLWPPYQDNEQLAKFMASTTQEELEYIRSQYFGKLTMVDRWFGELLSKLDQLALWEETMVMVTTDHGHDLGEQSVLEMVLTEMEVSTGARLLAAALSRWAGIVNSVL